MMDVLNGVKCLNPDIISNFLDGLADEDFVAVSHLDDINEISVAKFKEWSFLDNPADEDEIIIASDKRLLKIAGLDYNWWNTTRRKKKLFGQSASKPKQIKAAERFGVYVTTLTEDGLGMVSYHSGSKKDIINYMNEELYRRALKSFNEAIVLFKFDEDSAWMTVEELQQKGLIKLR